MKQLQELINTDEPGWDLVKEWLSLAVNSYEILPADKERAERELLLAQVTTRSPMGAIIYETGGILIDNGWIRISGSGSERLDRGLMEWNRGKSFLQQFYELFRWQNWKVDAGNINGNQTFSFFPFLWTKYDDFEQVSRKAVPVAENYQLTMEMKKQMTDR